MEGVFIFLSTGVFLINKYDVLSKTNVQEMLKIIQSLFHYTISMNENIFTDSILKVVFGFYNFQRLDSFMYFFNI